MKKKTIRFSRRHCISILRKGKAVQASDEAIEELQRALERYALDISRRAVLFAGDQERYRVKPEDIRNAVKEYAKDRSV